MKISQLPLLRLPLTPWAIYLGPRQAWLYGPAALPAGVSGLVGYYVRKRWRWYKRSYALEPSGTLPGELASMPKFRSLSRLSLLPSFRRNATRILEIAFGVGQSLTARDLEDPRAWCRIMYKV